MKFSSLFVFSGKVIEGLILEVVAISKVYLVRHAHSEYTPDEKNRQLSEKGRVDALKVCEILMHEEIDVVVSSPYMRAIQTVEGVAATLNDTVEIWEDFRERKIAENPVDDFNKTMGSLWRDFEFEIDGGESNILAQERGVKALFKCIEKYKNKNVVVGTHGNIMVLIMNYFNKKYGYEFWKTLNMPDIYCLEFVEKEIQSIRQVWCPSSKIEVVGEENSI